jgi:alanyl-tRNA synthetase
MMLCQENSYRQKDSVDITHVEYDVQTLPSIQVCISSQLFYPEGGGQSGDRGFLSCDSYVFDVVDTIQMDQLIYLDCRVRNMISPLEMVDFLDHFVGTTVLASIDWSHRFDNMQQHSGQHVLTATIIELYGWQTVGFHIGKDISTIDLDVPISEVSKWNIGHIEQEVNSKIRSVLPITHRWLSREVFDHCWKEGSIRSRGIPSHVKEQIRIVEISDTDANNCGGTHVCNTSELQVCVLLQVEKLQQRTRLYFLYGNRAIQHIHQLRSYQNRMTGILNQHPDNHHDLVLHSLQQRKSIQKRLERVLFLYLEEKFGQPLNSDDAHPNIGIYFEPDCSRSHLSHIQRMIRCHDQSHILLLGVPDGFLFDFGIYFQEIISHKSKILELIRGKGGGKPPVWQGKAESLTEGRLHKLLQFLQGILPSQ